MDDGLSGECLLLLVVTVSVLVGERVILYLGRRSEKQVRSWVPGT